MWLSIALAVFQGLLKALGLWSVTQERKAGAAESQNEANNADINRVNAAADAGNAAGGVQSGPTDPYDEAGK